MSEPRSLLKQWLRLLTFRTVYADFATLNWRHLLAGLAVCWLVGMGRYWDDPRATWMQHLGLGSVAYVFVLAAILWIIVKPLDPQHFSYVGVLTFITMTAPPAALYAIPIEKWMSLDGANHINLLFLGIVALWRLALWIHYLRCYGCLSGWRVIVCTILPVGIIFTALAALNLHHVIVDIMGGIREADKSSQDLAYDVIWLMTVFVVPMAAIAFVSWMTMAVLSLTDHAKARPGDTTAP